MSDIVQWILLALLTFFASGVGTLSGFGTSTIMVPILLFWLPLGETLLFVGVIHFFGDVWKVLLFRSGIRWKLLLGFGLASIIPTYVGARLALAAPESALLLVLGVLLIVYSLYLIWHPHFRVEPALSTVIWGGAGSGFFAGLFGIGGAVRGAALAAFNLPKEVYLATAGAIAIIADATRLSAYVSGDVRLPSSLAWSLLALVPVSFLAARAAQGVVRHVPQQKFRTLVAVFLLLIGLRLALFG